VGACVQYDRGEGDGKVCHAPNGVLPHAMTRPGRFQGGNKTGEENAHIGIAIIHDCVESRRWSLHEPQHWRQTSSMTAAMKQLDGIE
jgi:hypothetical protein